jgi:hypothetical protein
MRNSLVTPAPMSPTLGGMDEKAIKRAALITPQGAL